LAVQDVEHTNLRHHFQFVPDRRNALPHRHGDTCGGGGSIEDAADGLDATGNFLEGLRVDDEGGDFQLLQLGQEVSSEKVTRGSTESGCKLMMTSIFGWAYPTLGFCLAAAG